MKSKEIEKYEIMKLKYAEDTRAHGKQLRQLQFRRTRLGCPRRSFRSRRRPPEAAWATIARVAGPRRPRVGRPRFEHRRPDADATAPMMCCTSAACSGVRSSTPRPPLVCRACIAALNAPPVSPPGLTRPVL